MIDYCGNCGPKWIDPNNQVVTAQQCNLPAPSAPSLQAQGSFQVSGQTFGAQQGALQFSAQTCPPLPSCDLVLLNQQANTQENQTQCHYEGPPQVASNGCVVGCGTLVCNGPVRFVQIQMGQGSAVATWAPPLGASLGQTYMAELSYDGTSWRTLPLEQPWATFVRFQVDDGEKFQVRITANGYPSLVKLFDPTNTTKATNNGQ